MKKKKPDEVPIKEKIDEKNMTKEQADKLTDLENAKQSNPDGILTQEELQKEGGEKPSPSGKKKGKGKKRKLTENQLKKMQDVEMKFECGFAPPGKSNVAFNHVYNGKEYNYQLELENKIYTIPKSLKKEEIDRYRTALRANNFMDVTVIKAGAILDEKTKQYTYRVMHPEHTQKNRINGSIGLVLIDDNGSPLLHKKGPYAGQQITKQVDIVNGYVETDDPLVYEALLRANFCSAGKKAVEE